MKTLLSLSLIFLSYYSFSQDTISTFYDRATNFTLLPAEDAGYMLGTGYVDAGAGIMVSTSNETGMFFDNSSSINVTDLLVWFGNVVVYGSADTAEARIYTAGLDSLPLSGALEVKKISNDNLVFDLGNPTFSRFTFGSPVSLSTSYFVSVYYGTIDDTLGIITSDPQTADGQNEKRLRIYNSTFSTWYKHGDVLSVGANTIPIQFDADAMILPIVSSGSGVNDLNEILKVTVYPNPAINRVHFEGKSYSKVTIYDSFGRLVDEFSLSANSRRSVDVASWNSGTYYYSINNKSGRLGGKFQVGGE